MNELLAQLLDQYPGPTTIAIVILTMLLSRVPWRELFGNITMVIDRSQSRLDQEVMYQVQSKQDQLDYTQGQQNKILSDALDQNKETHEWLRHKVYQTLEALLELAKDTRTSSDNSYAHIDIIRRSQSQVQSDLSSLKAELKHIVQQFFDGEEEKFRQEVERMVYDQVVSQFEIHITPISNRLNRIEELLGVMAYVGELTEGIKDQVLEQAQKKDEVHHEE